MVENSPKILVSEEKATTTNPAVCANLTIAHSWPFKQLQRRRTAILVGDGAVD